MVAFSHPQICTTSALVATALAERSAKHTRTEDEFDHALTDESKDEAIPDDVNKDPFNPFGYGDAWALSLY